MISNDEQWISNDNGQWTMPLRGGIFLSISTQTSETLCAIG
jgi:hypothetical protein